jgi:hypothetical protein
MQGNGIGVKNEYLTFNAVSAVVNRDPESAARVLAASKQFNDEAPTTENELLSGRAGTLVLLRLVKRFVPGIEIDDIVRDIIEKMLANQPWTFHNVKYIGAGHGSIGIITQIVLSDPSYAPQVESNLEEILDQQCEDGHWYCRHARTDPADLVQFCHGSPGMLLSLLKIRQHFPRLEGKIARAIELGRKNIWEKGLLKKEPNVCHGITGNALALEVSFVLRLTFRVVEKI